MPRTSLMLVLLLVPPALIAADQDLMEAFASLPLVHRHDDGLYWGDAHIRFAITARHDDDAIVQTEAGPIRIAGSLLTGPREDGHLLLGQLVGHLQTADMTSDPAGPHLFSDSPVTGPRLRARGSLVLEDGPVTGQVLPQPDFAPALDTVGRAMANYISGLPSSLDVRARQVFANALQLVNERSRQDDATDELSPQFVRRLIRHGWLEDIVPGHPANQNLLAAVHAASTPQPIRRYLGRDIVLEEVANAFGDRAWVLRSPQRSRLTLRPPLPFYLNDSAARLTDAWLGIALPAGTDPLGTIDHSQITAVRLFHDGTTVASWTPKNGLRSDPERWREVVPAPSQAYIAPDLLPPHLVLVDYSQNVHALITKHGLLRPVQGRDRPSIEDFIERCAEMMTDVPHLDLVGQYLFRYAYDSPDPRLPALIGNRRIGGDIHQDVYQSLGSVTGGVARGDCEDLAEVYHTIVGRQGRTAHIINLPGHAAVAWAEHHDDGWSTYLMQTGPSLHFAADDLPSSLRLAYSHFDAGDVFDPHGVGLLLRFSGENTRSAWRLSHRIFSEPDYARTMIAVQRDWHYHTYLQGINTMEAMIADGDHDTANYRELAGLASYTGQHARAAHYLEEAIERTAEADSRLAISAELVMHLMAAGDAKHAHAVTESILTDQLPPLREQLGRAIVRFGLQLANALTKGDSYQAASQVLAETTMANFRQEQWIDKLGAWMKSARFDHEQWFTMPLRWEMVAAAATITDILWQVGPDLLHEDPYFAQQVQHVQRWLDEIAFHDDGPANMYAMAGHFYAAMLGRDRFLDMIENTEPPQRRLDSGARRDSGLIQLHRDLPWIRISTPFWLGALDLLLDDEHDLDPQLFERLAAGLQSALDTSAALHFDLNTLDDIRLRALITLALIGQDREDLRDLLGEIAVFDDKRLRDDITDRIGALARRLPMAWFKDVVALWSEIIDHKPAYLRIAWQAARHHAPAHALHAAQVASDRFPDDPAFADEKRFMRALLAEELGEEEEAAE